MSRPIDWADLPYFLAVVEEGSFRAAAEQLNTTHATVARHIQSLETIYGTRLFKRAPDGLSLTLAGEQLLPSVMQAEQSVLDGRRRVMGLDQEAAGSVRVSVPPILAATVLPEIFAEFSSSHLKIDLNIEITNTPQDLIRNKTDVSIRMAHSVDENVVGRKLLQYKLGVIASHRYVEEVLPSAGPLGEGLTWLGWGAWANDRGWVAESQFPKAELKHEVAEASMHAELLSQGLGMSLMPSFVAHYFPDLCLVPGTTSYLDRSIWLLLHGDLRKTVRVRLFVDFVAEQFRNREQLFAD